MFQKIEKKYSVDKTESDENVLHKFCCVETRLLMTATFEIFKNNFYHRTPQVAASESN